MLEGVIGPIGLFLVFEIILSNIISILISIKTIFFMFNGKHAWEGIFYLYLVTPPPKKILYTPLTKTNQGKPNKYWRPNKYARPKTAKKFRYR